MSFTNFINKPLNFGDVGRVLKPKNVISRLVLGWLRLNVNGELNLVRSQLLQKLGCLVMSNANKVSI